MVWNRGTKPSFPNVNVYTFFAFKANRICPYLINDCAIKGLEIYVKNYKHV